MSTVDAAPAAVASVMAHHSPATTRNRFIPRPPNPPLFLILDRGVVWAHVGLPATQHDPRDARRWTLASCGDAGVGGDRDRRLARRRAVRGARALQAAHHRADPRAC